MIETQSKSHNHMTQLYPMLTQSHQATIFNLNFTHATIEMLLSTIFTCEYTIEEQVLIASNETIEYRYTKGPSGNNLTVRLLSLEEMRLPLIVRYEDETKRFKVNKLDNQDGHVNPNTCMMLDVSQLKHD